MKQAISFLLIMVIALKGFSQTNTPDADYYWQKAKRQKTTAWILLGGGAALFTIGTILTSQIEVNGNDWGNLIDGSVFAGSIIGITGTCAMIASVPFFIAASRSRKNARAVSASLKMEKLIDIRRQSFVKISYPALLVKLNL